MYCVEKVTFCSADWHLPLRATPSPCLAYFIGCPRLHWQNADAIKDYLGLW